MQNSVQFEFRQDLRHYLTVCCEDIFNRFFIQRSIQQWSFPPIICHYRLKDKKFSFSIVYNKQTRPRFLAMANFSWLVFLQKNHGTLLLSHQSLHTCKVSRYPEQGLFTVGVKVHGKWDKNLKNLPAACEGSTRATFEKTVSLASRWREGSEVATFVTP